MKTVEDLNRLIRDEIAAIEALRSLSLIHI